MQKTKKECKKCSHNPNLKGVTRSFKCYTKKCPYYNRSRFDSVDKYEQLKTAVQDLLSELRIGPIDLTLMSDGFSPDYPGATQYFVSVKNRDVLYKGSTCKIQISQVVARKLIDADVIDSGIMPAWKGKGL